MKLKLAILTLFAAGAVSAQFSIGIRIGTPPPVRVQRVQPRKPGADFTWIAGYWYPSGNRYNRYKWHAGYWTRPPYSGARWVEPRHDGERFYTGHWVGGNGPVGHDHRWDRGRDRRRDYNRDQDRR